MRIHKLTTENQYNLIELILRLDKINLELFKSDDDLKALLKFNEVFQIDVSHYDDFHRRICYLRVAKEIYLLKIKSDNYYVDFRQLLKDVRYLNLSGNEDVQELIDEVINKDNLIHYKVLSKSYSYWGEIQKRIIS
ncbi:hypothetical protein [Pedobacter puniceum]|jgi:hypothetical protein|uniref:Uncharacterized protein n=1 Tax=Pedobacter puniceum TaxID=2666136 RepID=A0A7K0FQX1_9SPHI|nr:hypothetical protein [Pedobacter puniceum]MRX48031.1 hypothetical protein [Pedobacter puniceum]